MKAEIESRKSELTQLSNDANRKIESYQMGDVTLEKLKYFLTNIGKLTNTTDPQKKYDTLSILVDKILVDYLAEEKKFIFEITLKIPFDGTDKFVITDTGEIIIDDKQQATDSFRSFNMYNIAYFYPLQNKSKFLTSQ